MSYSGMHRPSRSDIKRYVDFTLLAHGIGFLVVLPAALLVAWLVLR